MPILKDSISHYFIDSLKIITDSLASIHRADSIQKASVDSIHQLSLMPSGFVGKPLPETLNENPFVTISLLILFLLFGYVLTYGRKMILETTKDFFYLKERSSIFIDSTANALQLKGCLVLIFLGSIGLFIYSLYFHGDTIISFQHKLLYLALFFAITLIFLVFKILTFRFLGYVFFDRNISSIFIKGYFTIIFGLGIAIFPIVVGLVYIPDSFFIPFLVIGLILVVATYLLVLYKIIQIFLANFYSLFYIILYLCTLEILPILIVLRSIS